MDTRRRPYSETASFSRLDPVVEEIRPRRIVLDLMDPLPVAVEDDEPLLGLVEAASDGGGGSAWQVITWCEEANDNNSARPGYRARPMMSMPGLMIKTNRRRQYDDGRRDCDNHIGQPKTPPKNSKHYDLDVIRSPLRYNTVPLAVPARQHAIDKRPMKMGDARVYEAVRLAAQTMRPSANRKTRSQTITPCA